jgi:hypothetical protein
MDYAKKVASQMKKGLSNEKSKIGEISRVLRDLGLSHVEVNYHMNVDEDFIPDVLGYYKHLKMDFQELNQKMNDSEYQYNVLLELGDTSGRAKNLKGIADGIDNQIEDLEHQVGANLPHFHKLKGYAEQLRLIADELLGWE